MTILIRKMKQIEIYQTHSFDGKSPESTDFSVPEGMFFMCGKSWHDYCLYLVAEVVVNLYEDWRAWQKWKLSSWN